MLNREVRAGSMEEEEVINSSGGGWGGVCIRKGVTEKVAIDLGFEGFRREYWVRKWVIRGAKEPFQSNQIWLKQT